MRTTIFSVTSIAMAGGLLIAAVASAQQGNTAATQPQPAGLAQAAAPAAGTERQLGSTPEEKAVLDGIMGFAKIYETANAAALAELFLDESMIVDPDGNATRGKAAVTAMYDAAFKANPGLKLEASVQDIRFLTPDLARVEGKAGSRALTATRRSLPVSPRCWLAATENGALPRSTSMPRRLKM